MVRKTSVVAQEEQSFSITESERQVVKSRVSGERNAKQQTKQEVCKTGLTSESCRAQVRVQQVALTVELRLSLETIFFSPVVFRRPRRTRAARRVVSCGRRAVHAYQQARTLAVWTYQVSEAAQVQRFVYLATIDSPRRLLNSRLCLPIARVLFAFNVSLLTH